MSTTPMAGAASVRAETFDLLRLARIFIRYRLRSMTRPARLMTPAASNSASVNEVLPVPPWPTNTTLRMWSIGNVFTQYLRGLRLGQAELLEDALCLPPREDLFLEGRMVGLVREL